jgi:hypothetical protein
LHDGFVLLPVWDDKLPRSIQGSAVGCH